MPDELPEMPKGHVVVAFNIGQVGSEVWIDGEPMDMKKVKGLEIEHWAGSMPCLKVTRYAQPLRVESDQIVVEEEEINGEGQR